LRAGLEQGVLIMNRSLRDRYVAMLRNYTNIYTRRTPTMDSEQERIVRELEELGARPRVLSEQCRPENQTRERRLGREEGGGTPEHADPPRASRTLDEMLDSLLTPATPRPAQIEWQPSNVSVSAGSAVPNRTDLRAEIEALRRVGDPHRNSVARMTAYIDGVEDVINILETRGIL
jgi:hypothetical protein